MLFRHDNIFAKTAYPLRHVCPSASISAAPTGRMYVKFDPGDFLEHQSKNTKVGQNRTKMPDTLPDNLSTFHHCRWHKVTIKAFCETFNAITPFTMTYLNDTHKVLFRFYCNNGHTKAPPCYVIRTLSILFMQILDTSLEFLCINTKKTEYSVLTGSFIKKVINFTRRHESAGTELTRIVSAYDWLLG